MNIFRKKTAHTGEHLFGEMLAIKATLGIALRHIGHDFDIESDLLAMRAATLMTGREAKISDATLDSFSETMGNFINCARDD